MSVASSIAVLAATLVCTATLWLAMAFAPGVAKSWFVRGASLTWHDCVVDPSRAIDDAAAGLRQRAGHVTVAIARIDDRSHRVRVESTSGIADWLEGGFDSPAWRAVLRSPHCELAGFELYAGPAMREPRALAALQVCFYLSAVIAFLLWRRWRDAPRADVTGPALRMAVLTGVVAVGWSAAVMSAASALGVDMQSHRDAWFLDQVRRQPFLLAVPLLLAPIAEELLFRGAMYGEFRIRDQPLLGAVVTSVAFCLFHAGAVGGGSASLAAGIAMFCVAVAFCWLLQRTAVIWTAVVAHVTYNAGALAMRAWSG